MSYAHPKHKISPHNPHKGNGKKVRKYAVDRTFSHLTHILFHTLYYYYLFIIKRISYRHGKNKDTSGVHDGRNA